MRLALDEMYTPEIARRLRRLRHDVTPVQERPDLLGPDDPDLWPLIQAERRTFVTNNPADFASLVALTFAAGEDHYGVLVSDDRRMPRHRGTIAVFVRSLERWLASHPTDDGFRNRWEYLAPPE